MLLDFPHFKLTLSLLSENTHTRAHSSIYTYKANAMLQSFISCSVIGFSRAQWGYELYMKRRAYGYKPLVLYINWVTLFHKRHLLTASISTGAQAQRWMTAGSAGETFTAETAAVTAGINSIGTRCSLYVSVALSRYHKDLGNLFFLFTTTVMVYD
jgi:hypothetical protein